MTIPFDIGHDRDHDGENGTVGRRETNTRRRGGSVSCFLFPHS